MYSPTTRLLAVLALLQSYSSISGAEMARRLEVDPRTVRRYIESLQDMGVPVEGERGPGGAYQLGRGSKMPPLMFTDEEAVALALGLRVLREFRFPVNAAAVEGALAKVERVLPELPLRQVRGLQGGITFNASSGYGATPPVLADNGTLVALSSAAHERIRVRLAYRAWDSTVSERSFDPYGVVYNEGYWYTAGYCHLRQDIRTFRLDRIQTLTVEDDSFERPDGFDLLAVVLAAVANVPGAYRVEVMFAATPEAIRQRIPPDVGTLETCPEGVIFRHTTTHLEWVAVMLMELDFPAEIHHPPELCDLLNQMAERAIRLANR